MMKFSGSVNGGVRTKLCCMLLACVLLTGLATTSSAQAIPPQLAKYDPSGQIRFQTSAEAEARREQMVRFIWPDGLTAARPRVTTGLADCPELAAVDRELISAIDLYDVDVAGMDFHALCYVAHPAKQHAGAARLAIVHAGHMPEGAANYLAAGLAEAIEALLREGYVVAAVQMPLAGWNQDADGQLPDAAKFSIERRLTSGHDELFSKVAGQLDGQTFRFFLEPVVQVTNEFLARYPRPERLLMIGLSGGGWTTHLSAAVDPRIDVAIPVAGALPLYARPFSPGSKGDAEQEYTPLFRERDTNDDQIPDAADGVASWMEIFALGGISAQPDRPRREVQVLNLYDSCCFSGRAFETYEDVVSSRAAAIPGSAWQPYLDESHRDHMISAEVIERVLVPLAQGQDVDD